MRFGLSFPHEAVPHQHGQLERFLREVDGAGFDFLSAYDHVIGADVSTRPDWIGPYTSANPLHEVFVLLAFASAVTSLELVTGVLVLPQRQAVLVAKQAADVDLLCGGHLRLGVAVGWNHVEFAALGERFEDRGGRLEEQVDVLRRLWTEESVTFEGRFHNLDRVAINPLPAQRPIPVWLGGAGPRNVRAEPQTEKVLDRIGRIGDGWVAGRRPLEELASSWTTIKAAAERAGRDPADLGLQIMASIRDPGEADEFTGVLEGWQKLGVTHVSFSLGERNAGFDDHLRLVNEMAPHLARWCNG